RKQKICNSLSYLKSLFIYCIPSVFIGLQILKLYEKSFNFDFLVSILIILTILLRSTIKKIVKKISKFKSKVILIIIGVSHGLTNSGGTLLSIFLLLSNKSKLDSRSEITLFYFILATAQLLIFHITFENNFVIEKFFNYLPSILGGVFLGNYLVNKVNFKLFSEIIYFLALSSGSFLIIKNIYKIF
ncbi:TSUP family transporter, partial [Candidatus Pelagibacter ubique]|nr:TSUP family transporter [Candidatus Pelagibacter ubique]